MYYLGIDLGGISIKSAVVDEQGHILGRSRILTPQTGAPDVARVMAQCARQAAETAGIGMEEIVSAGIGSPGTVDPERGRVEYWSNLNFLHVPLVALLREHLDLPIYLENDANAAALGEYIAGAGRGSRSMIAITLGTGVGGGAVLGGKLYTGFNHAGLEVGHFVVEHGGRRCTCGRRGCFETYASGAALGRRAREEMERHPESMLWQETGGNIDKVEGTTVFVTARKGDPTACALLREYQDYLACGIASLINIFQPELFCVGGGVSEEGDFLFDRVKQLVDEQDYARHSTERTRIVTAQLENDAGLIGAALLPLYL